MYFVRVVHALLRLGMRWRSSSGERVAEMFLRRSGESNN